MINYKSVAREVGKPAESRIDDLAVRLMFLYMDHRRESDPGYFGFSVKSPQSSKAWVHFLRTAKVVDELKADPSDYINAQFLFKTKSPYFNMLYSDYARDCYGKYMTEKKFVRDRVKPSHWKISVATVLATLFKKMSPLDAVESIRYMMDDDQYEEVIKLVEIYSPNKVVEILNG